MITRFDFLGVSISAINLDKTVKLLLDRAYSCPGYICFPDLSVIREASGDPFLQRILNESFLTLADGKPSQLAAWLQGYKNVGTVSGFHLCSALLQSDLTHFFYGGDDASLLRMKQQIALRYPNAAVLGFKAPPFVEKSKIATDMVIESDMDEIRMKNPDLLWVGISSPKQDYLMRRHYKTLNNSLLLGIGGAFLYFADEDLKSPEWMKTAGLRWLYRLGKEPSRLWPKYAAAIKFLIRNSGYFLKAMCRKIGGLSQADT